MDHLFRPELLLAVGAACAVAAGALFALVLVIGVIVIRRRRPSPVAREDTLAELGYQGVSAPASGPRSYTKPVYNTSLVFEDGAGWKWTIRLPRYNTLTWRVEERNGGATLGQAGAFVTENAELDGRFAMSADRAAQTLALATNRSVGTALLAAPFVSLSLRADELVLEDPGLRGLQKLTGGKVLGTPKALAAEREIHESVAVIVTAIFDSLYSKQNAMTLFDEHR